MYFNNRIDTIELIKREASFLFSLFVTLPFDYVTKNNV